MTQEGDLMFELTDIWYKHILNLNHLSIPKQKITFLMGRSGSGKTTLLKLLVKLISPTHGDITLNGQSLDQIDGVSHQKKCLSR
ncbi:MAG: ATP-binding cassette domain-containing protein [Acholeplasmataceae bacterium]|nr:ATP-binding cassette domain-containing protein [Acholeplasmataceae bacterium]